MWIKRCCCAIWLPYAVGSYLRYPRVLLTEEPNVASTILEKVRSEALNLPQSERAELAHSLLTSLDGQPDIDGSEAWDAEILRRLAEIDAGTTTLIHREEFRRRMRARMSRI